MYIRINKQPYILGNVQCKWNQTQFWITLGLEFLGKVPKIKGCINEKNVLKIKLKVFSNKIKIKTRIKVPFKSKT
jgi:hypothetical protein